MFSTKVLQHEEAFPRILHINAVYVFPKLIILKVYNKRELIRQDNMRKKFFSNNMFDESIHVLSWKIANLMIVFKLLILLFLVRDK